MTAETGSGSAAAARPARASEPDTSTTGVVFVHGIGAQARAETLLGWARPIVAAVADWAVSRPPESDGQGWSSDRVVRSTIDFESSDLPIVTIRVPETVEEGRTFPAQIWKMTEARWAPDVEPPTLATMIDWCGPRGVVAAVVGRIADRAMASESRIKEAAVASGRDGSQRRQRPATVARLAAATRKPRRQAGRALAEMGLSAIVSVFVSFGLLGYAIIRAIAGVTPFKPLQDALARISLDTFLTSWWGDVYVLLDDPVQAANIRGQVATSIANLRDEGCERIVVVAHSGGTIVSYMALSDPALEATADTLVTHGQAIGMGRLIHHDEGDAPTSPGVRIRQGAPLRITRWRDFHATHDPAPAGRLREADPASPPAPGVVFADTEVWNRMSIADDHGTYFTNDEEFVEPLLSEIELAGRPGAPSRFQADRAARIDRRQQRVFVLALWRRLMFVVPLVALMTAFLTPSEGLIPELSDVAGSILAFIPGGSELTDGLAELLPAAGPDWFLTAAASLFAVLYMLGIIQAILPIGRREIWSGWRRAVFVFLDAGIFFVGLAVAVGARALAVHDTGGGVSSLADRLGDAPLRNGFVIVALMFLALALEPLRRALDDAGERWPIVIRLLVVLGALAIVVVAVGGVLLDANIRRIVAGTVVALAIYQVLARVGAWRWARWDESERLIARRRSAVMFRRRTIWLEFLLLGALAAAVALAIGLGLVDLLLGSVVALVVLAGAFVVADVVARKAGLAGIRAARAPTPST